MPTDTPLMPGNDAAEPRGAFPPTEWTLVERAVSDDSEALNDLLRQYWKPIYIYVRGSGHAAAEAEDLTQAFLVHLLEKRLLDRVHLREVRLRAYLKSLLNGFLSNHGRTVRAVKRNPGVIREIAEVESRLAAVGTKSPEDDFDSMWALQRLEAALGRLRVELRAAGREWVADALAAQSSLGGQAESVQELSRRHGVSGNALSVALHRARARLRELLLADIRRTVGSADEAAEELSAMLAALGG